MRWRAARIAGLALLLAAAPAPFADAATERVRVEADGLQVRGALDLEASAPWSGSAAALLFLQLDEPAPAAVAVAGRDARVRVVNLPTLEVAATDPEGPTPVQLPEEEWYAGSGAGPVSARDARGEAWTTYRFLPAAPGGRLPLQLPAGAWSLSEPSDHAGRTRPTAFGGRSQVDGHAVLPQERTWMARGPPTGPVQLDGGFVALLFGGEVAWEDEAGPHRVEAGHRPNATRTLALAGRGVTAYDNVVVLVEAASGTLEPGGPAAGWGLLLAEAQVPAAQRILLRGTDGTVWMGSHAVSHRSQLVELDGELAVRGEAEDGFGRWSLRGEASRVAVDAGLRWASPEAAAAGLAALLLLFLSGFGRGVVTLIAGRHTPRLLKARLDGSAGRRLVLQAVHARQPASRGTLEAETGLSRTAVAYHLRILQAYEVVERIPARPGSPPAGRGDVYAINSGSLRIPIGPAGGATASTAAQALGAARSHPLRSALFDAIQALGRADFEALERGLRGSGAAVRLPRATASHHLAVLVRAGAIRRGREGRRIVYAPAVDPAEVAARQTRRLLADPHERALALDLARRGEVAARSLAATARRAADRLLRLGLAERGPRRTLRRTAALERLAPSLAREAA